MPSRNITLKCLVPTSHPESVRVQVLKNGTPQASKRMSAESAVKLAKELLTLAVPLLGGLNERPGANASGPVDEEYDEELNDA